MVVDKRQAGGFSQVDGVDVGLRELAIVAKVLLIVKQGLTDAYP